MRDELRLRPAWAAHSARAAARPTESYGYDANGNLASRTDFNNHTTTYSYDTLNRLLSKTADQFFVTNNCSGFGEFYLHGGRSAGGNNGRQRRDNQR
jgi:YD repeat-containing protein